MLVHSRLLLQRDDDLMADRPVGPAGDAASTVEATNEWEEYDKPRVRGIRIYGENEGIREIKFEDN